MHGFLRRRPRAVTVKILVALAVAFGIWTRPLAFVVALFVLGTALIARPFWTMEGAAPDANAINFYKNVFIMGRFLLLYVASATRYSLHVWLGRPGRFTNDRPE